METDWGSQLTFFEFTHLCEVLVKQEDKKKKEKKLGHFIKACREQKMPAAGFDSSQSFFPVMRLLVPHLDKRVYSIREAVMAQLFIDMLQIGATSLEAKKLKEYKNRKWFSFGADHSDFAAVLHSVIVSRCYDSTGITVAEVNMRLDQIISTNESEGKKSVALLLRDLFRKMNAQEMKWLVRVILKTMPLGLGDVALLKAMHPDAKDLLNVNANLESVCSRLTDPSVRLDQLEVTLMTPFAPQLADRKEVSEIPRRLKDRMFYIETKYDGERCQLHKKGELFRYFSRNGKDFTHEYGEDASDPRLFTSVISACLDSSVEEIILDGEICAWGKEQNCLIQKGEQFNIRQIRNDNDKFQQCLMLYDILLLNGRVLSGQPLRERLAVLRSVVRPQEGRVEMARRVEGRSAKDIQDELNEAIDRREEGLVVKDSESHYSPGLRAGSGWVKVKPDYQTDLMDTLDLVILGGYFGHGRSAGKITQFLMGVRSDEGDNFLSLCRVSTGFNVLELQDLVSRCTKGSRQENINLGKEKPPVVFDPVRCPVLELKATEIVPSDQYGAGSTLRFPRIIKMRDDKDSSCCTSLQEVTTIRKLYGDKHLDLEDQKKKRKRSSRKAQLAEIFQPLETRAGEPLLSHDLKGKVVVVEPGKSVKLKQEVERLVKMHGGKVEQNVRKGITGLYVETGMTLKGRHVVDKAEIDVVRSSWLTEQAESQKLEKAAPHQYLVMTPRTQREWRDLSDQYMDAFTLTASRGSLEWSMQKVHELKDDIPLDERQKADFEAETGLTDMKHNLFRGLVFHFPASDGEEGLSLRRDLLGLTVRQHGGTVARELDCHVTHVVTDLVTEDIRQTRRHRVNSGQKLFHLVATAWLEDCVAGRRLLPVTQYLK